MANKTDKIPTPGKTLIAENLLLSTIQLMKVFGIGRSSFDELKKMPGFPKPLKLNQRVIRWRTDEVVTWLNSLSKTKSA